jgi:hypothetical protein
MQAQRRLGRSIVGGWSNYRSADVILQFMNRGRWVNNLRSVSDQYGYYQFRVYAGLRFRVYVSTVVPFQMYLPDGAGIFGPGWITCYQTWADTSRSVTARRGRTHKVLNTTLRPVGQGRC